MLLRQKNKYPGLKREPPKYHDHDGKRRSGHNAEGGQGNQEDNPDDARVALFVAPVGSAEIFQ